MRGAAATPDPNPNTNPRSPPQNDDVINNDRPKRRTTGTNKRSHRRGGLGRPENSTFRYRGIRQRSWGKWVAEIRVANQRARRWLGTYSTAEQAANAYDRAAVEMFGARATLNLETSAAYLREPLGSGARPPSPPRPGPSSGSSSWTQNLRRILPRPPPPPPIPGLLHFGLYHGVVPQFGSLQAMAEHQYNMLNYTRIEADPTVIQPITQTTSFHQNPSDNININYYNNDEYHLLQQNLLDLHLQPGMYSGNTSSAVGLAGETDPPAAAMEDTLDLAAAATYNGYFMPASWLWGGEDDCPSMMSLLEDPFFRNSL